MSFLKIFFPLAFLSAFPLMGQINPTVTSSTGNFSLTCTNPSITLTASSSFTTAVSYTWTTPKMNIVNGNSVAASVPGIFSLAASSGTILQTTTISIAINTVQPTVTLTGASGSITCNTPTILLTTISSPTNVSYTWMEPGVGFGCTTSTCIAAQSGTYSVTVKDAANGCQKTATINIGDNRQYPIFSSISLYTVACPDGTVSLEPTLTTGTANISFQWKVPTGAITSATNNLNLITNAPGEYTLIATNTSNGCTSSTLVNVFACVGIYTHDMKNRYKLFPNPFTNKLNLDFSQAASSPEKIIIVNTVGQMVFEKGDLPPKMEIDLTFLPNGVYYVFVHDNGAIKRPLKVVKN